MIRYRKLIQIEPNQYGAYSIKTDMGQFYHTAAVNSVNGNTNRTAWWNMQNKSELREWQKDVFLGEFARLYTRMHWANEMQYYTVFEPGQGYNQAHDIVFARIPRENLWLLGTINKCWVQVSKYDTFDFDLSQPVIEDILDMESRFKYYKTVLEPVENHIIKKEREKHDQS